MFISREKKKESIAEYVIYMWQLEDILRATNFDIKQVEQIMLDNFDYTQEQREEAIYWYENMIESMRLEKVQENGHLQVLTNLISDLSQLHSELLSTPSESVYIGSYYSTLPYIVELRSKSERKDISEIETCFSALYGYILLRLQKKEISPETKAAVEQISSLLRLLSEKYYEREEPKQESNLEK